MSAERSSKRPQEIGWPSIRVASVMSTAALPLHTVLDVNADAGRNPKQQRLPPAGVRLVYDVTIEPVPPQPDTPFQQYVEAQRRYADGFRRWAVGEKAKAAGRYQSARAAAKVFQWNAI